MRQVRPATEAKLGHDITLHVEGKRHNKRDNI
jgi:hypothetical protein